MTKVNTMLTRHLISSGSAQKNITGNEMSEKINLYVVIRVDEFESVSGDELITIKEILPTLDEAVAEVERLNRLQAGKRCHYFWRLGRYFPQGTAKSDSE